MNVIEGVRRIGIVIGAGIFIASAIAYGISEAPSKERNAFSARYDLIEMIYNVQSDDFKKENVYPSSVERLIFPGKSSEEMISEICTKGRLPEIKLRCAEFEQQQSGIWKQWASHIPKAVGVGALCMGVFLMLWASLIWILKGFTRPKDGSTA